MQWVSRLLPFEAVLILVSFNKVYETTVDVAKQIERDGLMDLLRPAHEAGPSASLEAER
jgi:hypothetical protein